jgi:hypothetical protein
MSKSMREQIDRVKKWEQFLNENTNNISNVRRYLYDYFNLNDIIEPASIPIKNGYVRVYHQTNLDNFEKIKRDQEISIANSTGKLNMEPTIIWGAIVKDKNDRGFYGKPNEHFTIEYQVPSNEIDKGTGGVSRNIHSDEIIAYHDPRLFNIKNIIDEDDYLNEIINNIDSFMSYKNNNPLYNEYAYYLIANAIKNMS